MEETLPRSAAQASVTVDFDATAFPNRLNLGCGWDKREGFLNVDLMDMHSPDLVADVRNMPMLPSDHYAEILASDCLEHLPRPETDDILREWARLLAPGGVLHIRTSNVLGVAHLMQRSDSVEQHRLLIQCLFGTQAYPADTHINGFTDISLIDSLARAGLTRIVLEAKDTWLFDAEAAKPDGVIDTPLAVSWGIGCHLPEADASDNWRWFDREASVMLVNTSAEPVRVTLEGRMQASARRPSTLQVEMAGSRQTAHSWGRITPVRFSFVLPSGSARMRLRTTAPRLHAPDDARSLHYRLLAPALTVS